MEIQVLLNNYLAKGFPFIFVVVVWQGKLEECVPLFKKAITIWEKTGHPLLATGYNNLGPSTSSTPSSGTTYSATDSKKWTNGASDL